MVYSPPNNYSNSHKQPKQLIETLSSLKNDHTNNPYHSNFHSLQTHSIQLEMQRCHSIINYIDSNKLNQTVDSPVHCKLINMDVTLYFSVMVFVPVTTFRLFWWWITVIAVNEKKKPYLLHVKVVILMI